MRNRKSQSNQKLNYGRLEDRVLLAADLAGRNLVVNGGFDQVQISGDPNGLYDDSLVTGWNAINRELGQQLSIVTLASDRGAVLQIDSTNQLFDIVTQNIQTESSAQYMLAFDIRTRPVDVNADPVTNDLEVLWGGVSQGQFTAVDHWQTITMELTGDGSITELLFCEVSEPGRPNGDGRGPLLDNVRLVKVSDANLANGSFESGSGIGLIPSSNVSGWQTINNNGFLEIVESSDATDGNRYLSLDSTAQVLDRVFQSINTSEDATYFLSFDMRSSSGVPDAANELRVRWNNQWAGTFRGDGDWQNYGLVLTADSDATALVFREATLNGGFSTGDGPQIDNVQLFRLDSIVGDLEIDLNGDDVGNDLMSTFEEDGGAQQILTNDLDITNINGGQISSATVVLGNPLNFGNNGNSLEVLDVNTDGTNINAVYSPSLNTLRLTGTDSIANYESVLQTLTYDNNAPNLDTTTRNISISVSENGVASNVAQVGVEIADVDDAPIFVSDQSDTYPNATVEVGTQLQVQRIAYDPDATGITYSMTVDGEPFMLAGPQPTLSDDGTITWTPDRLGILNVTLTATDGTGNSIDLEFFIGSFSTNDEQRIQNYLLENNLTTQSTASGLHYIVTQEGNGNFPNENSQVTVNYRGTFLDGTEFDAGNNVTFGLQQVIEGWTEGIPMFSEGGSGTLIIPSDLAYGPAGRPGIPPNSILIFEVDLLSFV